MKHNLPANIKNYRKARALTQEQLAEAVGVTVGTVSKWENGNCLPDISMIVELADFFEISMDVLVGYDTPAKKIPEIIKRIEDYYKKHEIEDAIMECTKALVKYPNDFELLIRIARMRYINWYETGDEESRQQACTFYRKAQRFIPEDEKKMRNEFKILHNLALLESDNKKKIENLETINFNASLNAEIGEVYYEEGNQEKAYEYYSEALYVKSMDILNITGRWFDGLLAQKQYDKMLEMLEYSEMILKSLYREDRPSIGNKVLSQMEIIKAVVLDLLGRPDDMKVTVEDAIRHAKTFDESPAYDLSTGATLWLSKSTDDAPVAFDDQGPSALPAIEHLVQEFKNEYEGAVLASAERVQQYLNKIK